MGFDFSAILMAVKNYVSRVCRMPDKRDCIEAGWLPAE
jgi:hypothetical protein